MTSTKSYLKTLDLLIDDILYDIEENHFVLEMFYGNVELREVRQPEIKLYKIGNNKLISKYYDLITIREIVTKNDK